MQSYSQDLRERVLWALDRGERPSSIARRLEVTRASLQDEGEAAQGLAYLFAAAGTDRLTGALSRLNCRLAGLSATGPGPLFSGRELGRAGYVPHHAPLAEA